MVGTVIKFPDEGRIVRFGRDADESATIIILPVIRIERASRSPSLLPKQYLTIATLAYARAQTSLMATGPPPRS